MAQTAATDEHDKPGLVTLKQQPPLGDEIAAFPRVEPNATVSAAIAAKINASLARWDKQMLADARDCAKAEKESRPDDGESGDWSRTVSVTMQGPRYLSLLAEDAYDCGGAHPEDDRLALVYDVTTGEPVDWKQLLPAAAQEDKIRIPHSPTVVLVKWPLLLKKEQEEASGSEDCGDVYTTRDDIEFTLWLDADEGGVMFAPAGLSHIDSALCGTTLSLSAAEARRLGVAPDVVNALQEAKQMSTSPAHKSPGKK